MRIKLIFEIGRIHNLLKMHFVGSIAFKFADVGDFGGSNWKWWWSRRGEETAVCWRIWGDQRPECVDQVRLKSPNTGLWWPLNFQAGTIDTLAAMGKLVIQSSERIAESIFRGGNYGHWLLLFYAGGHGYLIGNHYWLCCVGYAHVSTKLIKMETQVKSVEVDFSIHILQFKQVPNF